MLVFGSEAEKDICAAVEKDPGGPSGPPGSYINFCGQLKLREFAAVLSHCKLLLCNDGGPLHIAMALGVKTVSIFGPVDEKVYGPYPAGEEHAVVKAALDCRPCYKQFRFDKCDDRRCLVSVAPEKVIEIASDMLGHGWIPDRSIRE